MLAIQQDPTQDLNPETLGALSALMLAQGQEIFVQKAIHGMRPVCYCLFVTLTSDLFLKYSILM